MGNENSIDEKKYSAFKKTHINALISGLREDDFSKDEIEEAIQTDEQFQDEFIRDLFRKSEIIYEIFKGIKKYYPGNDDLISQCEKYIDFSTQSLDDFNRLFAKLKNYVITKNIPTSANLLKDFKRMSHEVAPRDIAEGAEISKQNSILGDSLYAVFSQSGKRRKVEPGNPKLDTNKGKHLPDNTMQFKPAK